ncbi:hypothetical protein NG791_19315 [Laspinema sp. D1]|uniref:hypothetical protein n=1 Tax=Laspinema palackyanum TaxID=3231601 RepID=UPI0034912759|nr:hypothetical protein [Laspinema sp. D2b]
MLVVTTSVVSPVCSNDFSRSPPFVVTTSVVIPVRSNDFSRFRVGEHGYLASVATSGRVFVATGVELNPSGVVG